MPISGAHWEFWSFAKGGATLIANKTPRSNPSLVGRILSLPGDLWRFRARRHEINLEPPRALSVDFIPLSGAALCSECESISNCLNRCPACGSDALLAISRIIPRHRDSVRLVCVEPLPEKCCSQPEFYRPEKRDWFSPPLHEPKT
jgi:hypothetical protein